MDHIRYSVAACQTDSPNPLDRRGMRANTERMLSMIDSAVAGAAPATAESIIESIRSVFARIPRRSSGFGESV